MFTFQLTFYDLLNSHLILTWQGVLSDNCISVEHQARRQASGVCQSYVTSWSQRTYRRRNAAYTFFGGVTRSD